MDLITLGNLQFYMLAGMFTVGLVTFVIGVIILVTGFIEQDTRMLITQTNQLARKSLTEGIAGLVGNASTLLSTINDMVNTRKGTGLILMVGGGIMMVLPYWLTLIYK